MVSITSSSRMPYRPLIGACVLLALELLGIGVIFKHGIDFTCLSNWPQAACRGASGTLVAIYCVIGALCLLVLLYPGQFRRLFSDSSVRLWPFGLNMLGVVVALLPLTFMQNGVGPKAIMPAFACWTLGMGMILTGLALYAAPVTRWRQFWSDNWTHLVPVLLTGALAPAFATLIRPLWRLETMTDWTFAGVVWLLESFGYTPETFEGTKIIGVDPFYINIAPVCSGVEGIALVTLFVTLYLSLFRKDLRFPHAFLLYPIGILTSALFNVVRIAVLLIIGIEGKADLAVGGFHSHAGWFLFTIIALGIVMAAQSVPALQRSHISPIAGHAHNPLPFLQDPAAARILPFAIFMLSALLVSTFAQSPGVAYPLRVVAMASALALFANIYRQLPWRIDPVAVATGALIGLLWVVIPVAVEDPSAAPYGALTGLALVGWFVLRGVGTILLVPIIEELFFRDYLEPKLRLGDGRLWTVIAACGTAGLFALLHDRWAEAFMAGLAFSWVMQRHGRVSDAIVAHATANALVFAVAVSLGRLEIM